MAVDDLQPPSAMVGTSRNAATILAIGFPESNLPNGQTVVAASNQSDSWQVPEPLYWRLFRFRWISLQSRDWQRHNPTQDNRA